MEPGNIIRGEREVIGDTPQRDGSMSTHSIEATARIIEVLGPRTARASLPNGKRLLAFVPAREAPQELRVGTAVRVRIALADFSRGQVIGPVATDETPLPRGTTHPPS